MGQSGNLVVCGDAGDALGDSCYEARFFVRGTVKSLGADCEKKEMRPEHIEILTNLLEEAGIDADPPTSRATVLPATFITSTSITLLRIKGYLK